LVHSKMIGSSGCSDEDPAPIGGALRELQLAFLPHKRLLRRKKK
jgi:hypothetical protein